MLILGYCRSFNTPGPAYKLIPWICGFVCTALCVIGLITGISKNNYSMPTFIFLFILSFICTCIIGCETLKVSSYNNNSIQNAWWHLLMCYRKERHRFPMCTPNGNICFGWILHRMEEKEDFHSLKSFRLKKTKSLIEISGHDLLDIMIILLLTANVKFYIILLATKIDFPLSYKNV